MKKLLLGMVLCTSFMVNAGEVEILGDSSTLRGSFDGAKYDLGIEASVSFEDEFKIKFISPIIATDVSRDLLTDAPAVLNGTLEQIYLDLNDLKGAPDAVAFCANTDNAAVFTAANVACAAGSVPNNFKATVDLSVAYSIKGSIQLDVVAMKEAHSAITEPLIGLELGGQALTGSMVTLASASAMKVGASGGEIASVGYEALSSDLDKDIELTFEVPFKGSAFKSQRGEAIKLAVVAASL